MTYLLQSGTCVFRVERSGCNHLTKGLNGGYPDDASTDVTQCETHKVAHGVFLPKKRKKKFTLHLIKPVDLNFNF